MISDTQRCLLSCVSATRRSMCGCSRGIKASLKLRNNPWKNEEKRFIFFYSKHFLLRHINSNKSHLEQTESAWAELVFSLAVLERKKLDELIDEYRVWEVVKDDFLPLLRCKWKKDFQSDVVQHHWTVNTGHAPLSFPLWSSSVWVGPPGVHKLTVF